MKHVIGALLCSVFSLCVIAQSSFSAVDPEHIEISDSLTTTLIFPYCIIKASWCSPFLAVQQTREVGNVLEIKATAKDFSPTNLSVVTRDGEFYSFLLHYARNAYPLTLRFSKPTTKPSAVLLTEYPINDSRLAFISNELEMVHGQNLQQKSNKNAKLVLRHIIQDSIIHWLLLEFRNKSSGIVKISSIDISTERRKISPGLYSGEEKNIIYSNLPLAVSPKMSNKILVAFNGNVSSNKIIKVNIRDPEGESVFQLKIKNKIIRRHLHPIQSIYACPTKRSE